MTFDELKGVEELVERMRQAPDRLWMADLVGQKISIERMRDILAFALAQQPAAVDEAMRKAAAKAWQQGYHQGILDERISEANIGIAGFAAKVEPARTNPYLAQQPAAVADATVARLTKDQRARLVEKLVADQVEGADRLSSYLWDVLKNGFRGYSNYTDQELLDAHWDAFDEDFFGLESGDDQ